MSIQTQSSCPNCGGDVRLDKKHGESICSDCGTVTEEQAVDRGPEWRAFDAEGRSEKSRVGAPLTPARHDRGLSTEISWQDKDAYGESLSTRKRKQMQRLREKHAWAQTDSTTRGLRKALNEIHRMASALGLPKTIRETASVIYRRAQDLGVVKGRSIEGVASGALYLAAREAGIPRTLDEAERVSRVDRRPIARAQWVLKNELRLEIAPADPRSYLPRYATLLDASDAIERGARDILDAAAGEYLGSGKDPSALAAAALYIAGLLNDEHITQREIKEATDTTRVTLQTHHPELSKYYEQND